MSSTRSDALEPVVLALCKAIDSPRSLAVWLCFKYNQEALLELPPAAIADSDTDAFQKDYFITEYLTKYKGLKVPHDTRKVALGKWRLSEQMCLETNSAFRNARLRPFTGRVEAVLFRAQRKIASCLGVLNLPVALSDCKWGPGATLDMKREDATPDKKISQPISVTAPALPYLKAVLESDPHWAACFLGVVPEAAYSLLPETTFKVVKGSRLLTVPKSAKTDRVIAAEPTGNSFLQQGVRSYMRRRLKRFGVDLDDQSINQARAAAAYSAGLSTLDLSMASDTIARELVYSLLPLSWALFLDALRSPETLVDGEWVRTEKFASMGNAFCFELESLIFWALASSVTEELEGSVAEATVYGDDIIIDRRAYDPLVEILQVCGFKVNLDKSYRDGYFFESCGKHFHRGRDVTPCYQKEPVRALPEIVRAHNRLYRLATRMPNGQKLTNRACRALRDAYSVRPIPQVPHGISEDSGFLRPLSNFTLDRNRGYRCHVLVFKPQLTAAREDAMYAYKLRRFEQQNPSRKGYAGNAKKGRWRSETRWIPEANTLDGWSEQDQQ